MLRAILVLCCSLNALAQTPQFSPVDAAIQAYHKARAEGRFDEAAARRDAARDLLARTPVESERFAAQVHSVAVLYENGGMHTKAREIREGALTRTAQMPDSSPTRIQLFTAMASYWQQDRNLLKAVPYLEKVAAALESAPPPSPAAAAATAAVREARFVAISGPNIRGGSPYFAGAGPASRLSSVYQQLITLYQQLGRADAIDAVLAKIKKLPDGDAYLASFLEGQGRFDDAAAIYQKLAAQPSADPRQSQAALQQLANLYQREQRLGDAATAMQQAIAIADGPGNAQTKSQSLYLKQNLADLLRQSGQIDKADLVYQELLADMQSRQDPNYPQVLAGYANYLGNTDRAGKAEALLNDYAASQAHLEPWQEVTLLYGRAAVARRAGDTARAAEFERQAQAKNQAANPVVTDEARVYNLLQKANLLANSGKADESFSTALEALSMAARAADRDQVGWQIPNIASSLAAKDPARSAQLYVQLLALVDSWSQETLNPLVNATQNYARFLLGRIGSEGEALDAIERYRTVLIASRGDGSGHLQDVFQMKIDFALSHNSPKQALLASQDLLNFEESVNGATSEPYLHVLEMMAQLSENAGDEESALRQYRQAIAIGDLVYYPSDGRRAYTRSRVAMSLARHRQFDEAERLATEAVAVSRLMIPPDTERFTRELEQIRAMKAAPAKSQSPRPTGGVILMRN